MAKILGKESSPMAAEFIPDFQLIRAFNLSGKLINCVWANSRMGKLLTAVML